MEMLANGAACAKGRYLEKPSEAGDTPDHSDWRIRPLRKRML